MKRLVYFMIALAMTAVTLTSCSDVDGPFLAPVNPNNGTNTETFEATGSGTLDAPFNVQGIIDLTTSLGSAESADWYYFKGYVTEIKEISAQYGNATFYISDSPEGGNKFYIFRCKGLDNASVTDENFLKLGDEVVMYGKVINYQGNTPETVQGSAYVYSVNGAGGSSETPSDELKTATIAEFNAAAESTSVWYQLTGTVKNLKDGDIYGNFDIEDETGSVYVYGLLAEKDGESKKFQDLVAAKGIKNGSKITIAGNRGSYKDKIEVMNAYFISIEEGENTGGGETTSDFEAGKYFFVNKDGSTYSVGYPVEAGKSYGYINVTSASIASDGTLSADDANLFTFTKDGDGYTIQDASGVYYYMQGTYNSFQLSSSKPSENATWSVNVNSDGTATIKNIGTGKTIQMSSYGNFCPYTDVTGALPYLVKKGEKISDGGNTGGGDTGGNTESSTTITLADFGLANQADLTTLTASDGTTLTFSQEGGSTPPKYYTSGSAARMYALNSLTIKGSKAMTKVVLTCAMNGTNPANGNSQMYGEAGGSKVTKTVDSDTQVTFSGFSNSTLKIVNDYTEAKAGTQLRIVSIAITYAN